MKRFWIFLLLFLLAGAVVVLVAYQLAMRQQEARMPQLPAPAPSFVAQTREAMLYFSDPEGSYLVAETRMLPACDGELPCLLQTVEAALQGSETGMVNIYPRNTRLLGAEFRDGEVVLDFDRSFLTYHPGGTLPELLTVYGLANTVAVNFPYVRQIRILIEGAAIPSIRGHLDLRGPVSADFQYTRPPEKMTNPQAPQGGAGGE